MKAKLDSIIVTVPDLEKELAATISELLQFRSENPPVEDYDVQLFLKDELEKVGLKVRLHHPGDRAVALTSRFGDSERPGLIFYGHADVVPAGDRKGWTHPPHSGKIVNGRVCGRGAADMKAALAAELFAFRLLYKNEVKLPGQLEFVSVLDEESWHRTPIGYGTSDWLLGTGKLTGKSCVMGEPGGVSKICVGERGDYWIKLRASAKPRHGSTPVYDENPCVKLFKCIHEIREATKEKARPPKEIEHLVKPSSVILREDLGNSGISGDKTAEDLLTHYSLNVGVVSGGTMINVVPEHCEVEVAFCIPLGATRQQLDRKIRRILRSSQFSDITLEYLGESDAAGPSYTSPKSRLVKTLSEATNQILGSPASLFITPGTSDANVFRSHGVDTCFYGPGTFEGAHAYNESVSIRATLTALRVYLRLVGDFFGVS